MNLDDETFSVHEFLSASVDEMSPNDARELINIWEANFSPPQSVIKAFNTVFLVLEKVLDQYRDLVIKQNILQKKNEKLQLELEELRNGSQKKVRKVKA